MAVKLLVSEPCKIGLFETKDHGPCTMIYTLGGKNFFKGQPAGLKDGEIYPSIEIELPCVPEMRQIVSFKVGK